MTVDCSPEIAMRLRLDWRQPSSPVFALLEFIAKGARISPATYPRTSSPITSTSWMEPMEEAMRQRPQS